MGAKGRRRFFIMKHEKSDLMINPVILGENIKRLRKFSGLSQTQLAQKTGVIQTEISKWEKGKKLISLENTAKIAKAIGCEVDDLIRSAVRQ